MNRALLTIALGLIALFIVSASRPPLPVDETRYLSVAWEMLVQKHWILPTLNFEPYPHKPPLLFWIIRASWEIFGVNVWGPRLVLFTALGFLFFAVARLARHLFPQRVDVPPVAVLFLTALPGFLAYASTIRFDVLLTLCVVLGLLALWRTAQQPDIRNWSLFGLALGAGILAKGPVALVYLLPCALLAPIWSNHKNRKWYGGVILAVVIGAAIALCWAIPAALQGGESYAQKIFITQSANRMVQAFDHVEPFWFYVPVLIGFLLPLVAFPALWHKIAFNSQLKFLLCTILPAFLFFSIISSKQIHYMLPLMPAFAIAAASVMNEQKLRWTIIPIALLVAPSLIMLIHSDTTREKLFGFYPTVAIMHVLIAGLLALWAWHRSHMTAHALAISSFLMVVVLHVQLSAGFFPRFDTQPIADALKLYETREIAAAPKYDGEYGFALRTQKPIASVGRENIDEWFQQNPDGVVIGRYKPSTKPADYKILYEQDFRTDESLLILEK